MLSKNEVKDIQSLRHKKLRDEGKLFVAEGPKMIMELLQLVPQQVERVLAVGEWIALNKHLLQTIRYQSITGEELQKISQLQTPNQAVAVLKQFEPHLPQANGFTLYLDTVQDPGNFGTIIRIADWFGITDVVCTEGCADLYNPKVVQATMASIARVNVYYDKEMQWLQQQKAPVYAAVLNGKPLHQFTTAEAGVLIIGNESKGIRHELLELATHPITIPRKGSAESLNAAVATGIILSHLIGDGL